MHVSCSRVLEHDPTVVATKQALRAHSDYIYNSHVVDTLYQYHEHFDIMVEAKEKNFAQQQLVDKWVEKFRFDPQVGF
jgi:UV DNA damage repair endonuclease